MLSTLINLKQERDILSLVAQFGQPRAAVVQLKQHFANRKPDPEESYYYYDGPNDEKTRPFCKQMLKIDKVFSQSDIDIISRSLGYSVLKYKGSYNCRHRWVLFRGKTISTPDTTAGNIRSLINKGISAK